MVFADALKMATALKSNMMMVDGVVILMNAKLLNIMGVVGQKLWNAMEKLWDSNSNATTTMKIPHHAIIMPLILIEILKKGDPIWISAKMAGMNDIYDKPSYQK